MDPAQYDRHHQQHAERQPNERTENQFRSEKPAVVVVFDGLEVKEKAQGFGDLFLPFAFRIHSVNRDNTEFLGRSTLCHRNILGDAPSILEISG
jgi:hypothetical protein